MNAQQSATGKKERPIRVLVVDDSSMMRHILKDIIEQDDGIRVIGTAGNGEEALEKVEALGPDVVTMDIEMPKMDGVTALREIMRIHPVPVIMISGFAKPHADLTMKALALGAVDFVPKTSGGLSLDIYKKEKDITDKIRAASKIKDLTPFKAASNSILLDKAKSRSRKEKYVILIGVSTGGPKALPEILSKLPGDLPAAILIVQHMPKGFTRSFAEHLNSYSHIEVREAEKGDEILAGKVLIAPGDYHMTVEGSRIELTSDPAVNFVRPSADVLMKSAARAFGNRCIGIVLTGMGNDGAEGLCDIKKEGGRTIAQDEDSCVIFGMPKAAIDMGVVDMVSPLRDIPRNVVKLIGG